MKEKRKIIPGIYGIYSRTKNKWYIGESKDIFDRWSDHKKILKSNKHHSTKLQRHFNKYGIQDFDFVVLMEAENDRSFWERFLIKCFDSYKNGFNETEGGECPPIKTKNFHLQNFFTKEIVCGTNIKRFAIDRNLSKSSLQAVIQGKYHHTEGWFSLDKNSIFKPYILVSPSGQLHTFLNIADFAADHGLKAGQLVNILNGYTKYHRGWHHPDIPPQPKQKIAWNAKSFRLVSPEGKLISGFSLGHFAKTNNLNQGNLQSVLVGNRPNHKGWRKYIDQASLVPFDFNKYKFISPSGELIESNSIINIANEFNLDKHKLSGVWCGKFKSHKQWRKAILL